MYGGFSGSQGMVLYDTKKPGDNGVYGYYEAEEIVLVSGEYKALRNLQKEREAPYKREDDPLLKYMAILFVLDVAAVVLSFVFGSFLTGSSVLVFAAGSYFPVLVIGFAHIIDYRTKALHEQFRRFHGCEHQSVSWLTRRNMDEELTVESLKKENIYDAECGTAYAGYFLTLAAAAALLLANIVSLGLLKAMGILLAVIVVLVINIFNPYNPYLLLQRSVVAEPGDKEYELALAMIEKLNHRPMNNDDREKV